jgi:acylphosphatase
LPERNEAMMTGRRKAVRAHIRGRVQGVNYRAWTQGEAMALGLPGWVRNEPDGSVRALLVGEEGAVAEMVERLRRGPRAAAVSAVVTEDANVGEASDRFRITG